jgi:choline dehydrogenase
VAARVSEDPDVRVLLIEAGSHDGTDAMKVPVEWLTLVGSDVDWVFVQHHKQRLAAQPSRIRAEE